MLLKKVEQRGSLFLKVPNLLKEIFGDKCFDVRCQDIVQHLSKMNKTFKDESSFI